MDVCCHCFCLFVCLFGLPGLGLVVLGWVGFVLFCFDLFCFVS